MSGILDRRDNWSNEAIARLLRELAQELRGAEGMARNGLFLELHRLQDNLFRYTLEQHPKAAMSLAAQAFAVQDGLPSPQVLQELTRLGTPWLDSEIRRRYRGMNAARNDMAHEAVLARRVVSRRKCNEMAQLAMRVADAIDPAQRGLPQRKATSTPSSRAVAHRWPLLLLGLALGLALWATWNSSDLYFAAAGIVTATVVALTVWWDRYGR
ncbi:MAG: hypothetical protein H6638_08745 [Ardenticatenales bacterium]|nr:hypothetical protein [Ardenticatenales bacterium]MCB9171993.1 hypothetical protein [Ardenticatenales bacterium]